jgi:hypothetical protein
MADFSPIISQPMVNGIFCIHEVLMPTLHDIDFDMERTQGNHNLVGLIQETTSYAATWLTTFPRPTRLAAYDNQIPNNATPVVRNRMEAIHKGKIHDYASYLTANAVLHSSSAPSLTKFGTRTSEII